MSRFIVYPTRQLALDRSHAEMRKSSGWRSTNVTQYRWTVIEDEQTREGLLEVVDYEVERLSTRELNQSLTEEEARARPGFPRIE